MLLRYREVFLGPRKEPRFYLGPIRNSIGIFMRSIVENQHDMLRLIKLVLVNTIDNLYDTLHRIRKYTSLWRTVFYMF